MSRNETKTKLDQELLSYVESYQDKVGENHFKYVLKLENKISLLEERISNLEYEYGKIYDLQEKNRELVIECQNNILQTKWELETITQTFNERRIKY